MEKHHWKQFVNLDYIGAYCMGGKDKAVKILSVGQEMVTGEKGKKEMCMVARLDGEKPFIINRTNAKMITKLVGSPYVEDWVGKTIVLYPTTTSVGGETVECLRVRPKLPEARQKETLTPDHPKWTDVVAWVKSGGAMESIMAKYDVSDEVAGMVRKEAGV